MSYSFSLLQNADLLKLSGSGDLTEAGDAMKKPTQLKSGSAFSLVELLVVIAVIAIIAAIAIPNIASITNTADTAKEQRNAQTLSSVYNAARAAGWNASHANEGAAVTAIVTGVTGDQDVNGIPDGMQFGVPNLSATEQTAAINFLDLSANDATGSLNYDPGS